MEKLKCNSGNFYIVAVAVVEDKDGEVKKVRKTIVVEAVSFAEAEEKAFDSMRDYSTGDVEVLNITPAAFREVYSSSEGDDDKFYKGTVDYITLNENTGKPKKTKQSMLIQANCLNRATRYLDEIMRKSMVDYSSVSVSETQVFDCFFIRKVKANDQQG